MADGVETEIEFGRDIIFADEFYALAFPEERIRVYKHNHIFIPLSSFIVERNSEARKLWHDALVSGEYKQCKRRMKIQKFFSTKYCALGVGDDIYNAGSDKFFRKISIIPPEQLDYIDTNPFTAYNTITECRVSTVALNDDYNLTFKEIARLVYPEQYFPRIVI